MSPAPFEYAGLDRLLHERARLSVLASLAAQRDSLDTHRAEQAALAGNRSLAADRPTGGRPEKGGRAAPGGLQFNDLKRLCGLTDGNLSRHLTILQRAGLIEIAKDYYRNRPRTICRLTPTGRSRFAAYVDQLQQVIADATAAAAPARGRKAGLRRTPAFEGSQ